VGARKGGERTRIPTKKRTIRKKSGSSKKRVTTLKDLGGFSLTRIRQCDYEDPPFVRGGSVKSKRDFLTKEDG